MSPAAARLAPLRQQLADYDQLLRTAWPKAQAARLRRGRAICAALLRELAGVLIATGVRA